MIRLWLIDFDEAHPCVEKPVVMQCDHEPTEEMAQNAIYEHRITSGAVYINLITETSEREMRGKDYYIVGEK